MQAFYDGFEGRNTLSCFTDVSDENWNNWQWQKRNAIVIHPADTKKEAKIDILLQLLDHDCPVSKQILLQEAEKWAINIPPHLIVQLARLKTAGLTEWRTQMLNFALPSAHNIKPIKKPQGFKEGMGTTQQKERKYPDLPLCMSRLYDNRAIVRLSSICSMACQFCFRQHDIAERYELENDIRKDLPNAIDYVTKWNKNNPQSPLTDIIFSGGDPLSLADDVLFDIMKRFETIDGVRMLRLDTKYPATIPQRITPEFINGLKEFNAILIMDIHFTHPGELCNETRSVCKKLANTGIILGSHTPLLKNVNNDRQTLITLFTELLFMKVRPYYLIQYIYTPGTERFQTPIEEGLELIKYWEKDIPGLAQPHFIVYTIEGGGKVHMQPDCLMKVGGQCIIETHQGKELYPEFNL